MIRATILGCGSSGGVPRFGGLNGEGDWEDCDPSNPKNARLRCALLLEKTSPKGSTKICIDAGADFRTQMLRAKVDMLDALVLTHEHADHIHGIDDMRQFVNIRTYETLKSLREKGDINRDDYLDAVEKARIDCFAGGSCFEAMRTRFDYLFIPEEGSLYPPIMHLRPINGDFSIAGNGGEISFIPFAVPHGSINAFGFKIKGLVYLPDVQNLTDEARAHISGCETLIIDCLQFRTHGTHANFEMTMNWIDELKPERAILTNLHSSMDYQTIDKMTPDHVMPAFDGMQIEL